MTSPAAITYGPIFIGVVFNLVLYGIMITQTFLYFTVYKSDKLWIKLYVALLFLCDTLNCGFDIAFVYVPLVNKYGDVNALSYATWVFGTDPAMTAIIALLVQMFFAWRVKVLTGSTFTTLLISLFSLCQWCGGLGTSIAVGMIPEFIHFQKFKAIVIIWLTFSAAADVLITAALVWHLRKHKTGFSATDDIVNKIIRMTVQTGMITALCAIIDLILFLASPSGLHLIFNLPLSKLYTNSLMSSLNSRAGWKYGNSVGKALNGQVGTVDTLRGGRVHMGTDIQVSRQVFVQVESHEMDHKEDFRSGDPLDASTVEYGQNHASSSTEKVVRISAGTAAGMA